MSAAHEIKEEQGQRLTMAQHIGDSQEFGTPDIVSSSGARVGMSHHEPSLDIGSSSSEEERERR